MASQQQLSMNLGLGQTPESKDPDTIGDLTRIYNAIKILAGVVDIYTGVGVNSKDDWSQIGIGSFLLQNTTKVYVIFDETCIPGQLLHLYNNSGAIHARLANATDNTKPARAFAPSSVTVGDYGLCYLLGANAHVTGLNPGTPYYLSTVSGLFTSVKPVSVGNLQQVVGFALSSSILYFNPNLDGPVA